MFWTTSKRHCAADFRGGRKGSETVYVLTRALEIVSEASRRLPEDLKDRYRGIDWPAVAASGNVYRHEYEAVDERQLWHTVHHGLGVLLHLATTGLKRLRSLALHVPRAQPRPTQLDAAQSQGNVLDSPVDPGKRREHIPHDQNDRDNESYESEHLSNVAHASKDNTGFGLRAASRERHAGTLPCWAWHRHAPTRTLLARGR
jgi:uncharacterized protein with HEPN domain